MTQQTCVVGGLGFVGSNVVAHLNKKGIRPLILRRGIGENWRNVAGLSFDLIHNVADIPWAAIVVHLGANVDTTERMNPDLWANNVDFAVTLQKQTENRGGKFIYASSASVYGAEERDFTERIEGLKPLNAYGFTKWQLDNTFFGAGPAAKAYGLRFFNVYGPNENDKGNMASVIHKGLNKVRPLYEPDDAFHGVKRPHWSLFKSDKPISRDFVFCGDVAKVILHFIDTPDIPPGVFNVGSGRNVTFEEVVKMIDPALDIEYIPLPAIMKPGYQHFSKADLTKLREVAGYRDEFLTVEQGIAEMKKSIIL